MAAEQASLHGAQKLADGFAIVADQGYCHDFHGRSFSTLAVIGHPVYIHSPHYFHHAMTTTGHLSMEYHPFLRQQSVAMRDVTG